MDNLECQDCGRTLQISPRGELQGVACPDCGGQRMFRSQPSPVQSDGTLRDLVDMDTGKDQGGSPDSEGILAPPSGHSILTAFAGGTLCPHCDAPLMDTDEACPHCGQPSGIPAELRPEIAGAPLTEGILGISEHTDPYDTGAHGRDEYTHSHVVLAALLEEEPDPELDHYDNEDSPDAGQIHILPYEKSGNGRHQVMVIDRNGNSQWPTEYEPGRYGWDRPEDIVTPHEMLEQAHEYAHALDHTRGTRDNPNPRPTPNADEHGYLPFHFPGLEYAPADPWQDEQFRSLPQHPDPMMDNEPGTLTIPQGHPALWYSRTGALDPHAIHQLTPHIEHAIHTRKAPEWLMQLIGPVLMGGMAGIGWGASKAYGPGSKWEQEQQEQKEQREAAANDLYRSKGAEYELTNQGLDRLREMLRTMRDRAEESGIIPMQSRDVLFEPPAAKPATPKCSGCGKPIQDWGPAATEGVYTCPNCGQLSFVSKTEDDHILAAVVDPWDEDEDETQGSDMRMPPHVPGVHNTEPNAFSGIRCPSCGHEVMADPGGEDAFCTHCNQQWSVHRDEPWGKQHFLPADMYEYVNKMVGPPRPDELATLHPSKEFPGIVLPEMGTSFGPEHYGSHGFMRWTPGMHGRGLLIMGEPHTWNAYDPQEIEKSTVYGDIPTPNLGMRHSEYVASLGIDPKHADWNSGVEIRPNGEIEAYQGQDVSPFIEGDPRLKELEGKHFTFGSTMPHDETSKRELYDSWQHQADVMFDKGPLQNVPAAHQAAQPSEAGLHKRHASPHQTLAFLDAHINGIPVRTRGMEVVQKHGPLGPEYNKPVIVAVHDPAHLAAAVEAVEHPLGWSQQMKQLAQQIQGGEVAPPPGIDATSLQPQPGAFPPSVSKKTSSVWEGLAKAALPIAGLALAPETGGASLALDAGEGAALLGEGAAAGDAVAGVADAAGASKGVGALMQKAMSGAGGAAKGLGTLDLAKMGLGAGENALGLGGGGQGGGGAQQPYNGPLQQFTHVLAAFVEADYETPSSVPDVGVKHDDPEDVDQKEFNDLDKSPKNLLNPNFQDSGASGEDEVRNESGKPTTYAFNPGGEAIKRFEMLMPLIEEYYHSDKSGADDPHLRELHQMLEQEYPGYLNDADPEIAERFMNSKRQPQQVHAAGPVDPSLPLYPQVRQQMRSPEDRRQFDQDLGLQDRREQPERRAQQHAYTPTPGMPGTCMQCGREEHAPVHGITIPVAASVKESVIPPMAPSNHTQNQLALDPTGADAQARGLPPGAQNPLNLWNRSGVPPEQRRGVDPADKGMDDSTLPGAENQEEPQQADPTQWGSMPPNVRASHEDILAALIEGANHQGPVTPEQIASVQQYLVQHGRAHEAPNVELDPSNPEYVKILSEIQDRPNVPPSITPEEQTKPMPPAPAPPGGAMPVPGMAPGETGGQPMQPLAHLSFLEADEGFRHIGADNIAPRCPKCNNATTGMVDGEKAHCHNCGNVWKVPDITSDESMGMTSISRTALRDAPAEHPHKPQANPVGVPAAEQEEQTDQGGDQDSSLVWKDKSGEKLVAGQTYEMHNPSYTLPDLIRVERVKPDGIDVTLLGTYANDPTQEDPNRLTSSTPISKEDAELQELTFEPVAQSQEDVGNEPPPGGQAPGLPPTRPTTDEQTAREPQLAHVEDDSCPKCGGREHTSAMISPEATEHDCYYCGHVWVTEERTAGAHMEDGEWVNPNAQWLLEDDDAEDLSPRRAGMMEASQQSKNIGDIASRDPRREAIREYLSEQGRERRERIAGRHFTPREQRDLIDEDGRARNRDLLDLEGTHYKVRESWDSKAKPERVRDNDLFLGL